MYVKSLHLNAPTGTYTIASTDLATRSFFSCNPAQRHIGECFRRDLTGAQARRVIKDLRGDHQFIRAGLLDELLQIRVHHLGSTDGGAREHLLEDRPLLRPEALRVPL